MPKQKFNAMPPPPAPPNDNSLALQKKHTIPSISKKQSQLVKFEVDACSTSHHAGCIGHHHRHSTHASIQDMPSSSKPSHSTGQHSSYLQHYIYKGNKTSNPSTPSNKQVVPSSSVLKNRKPILINSRSARSSRHHHQDVYASNTSTTGGQECTKCRSNAPQVKFASDQATSNNKSIMCCGLSSNTKNSTTCSQQCTKSIICCNADHLDVRCNSNCLINCLKNKTLMRIFRYLNHSDLLQCRAVQKHWNELISNDESFLDSTVFVSNIPKSYNAITDTLLYNNDPLTYIACLPFRHGRIQYFDYFYYRDPRAFNMRNSDNEKYSPKTSFLKNLVSLELDRSYILWQTLKRILVKCIMLDTLIISKCHIADSPISATDIRQFDDFTTGHIVCGLKALKIYETKYLKNITKILDKFVGYSSGNLTTLKITYYPPESRNAGNDMKSECFDFCQKLKALITLNTAKLQVLNLDIQHEPTLDLIGCHLSKELEAIGSSAGLDLKEFQLSPAIGCWLQQPSDTPKRDVAMTMETDKIAQKTMKKFVTSFQGFLASQKNLTKLGLPCIEFPNAQSKDFKLVMQRLPCADKLEELNIPCTGFLPEDFLHRFPKLRKIKVGCSCCDDVTPCWDIIKHYTGSQSDSRTNVSETCERKLSVANTQVKITSKTHRTHRTVVPNSAASLQSLDKMKNLKELSVATIKSPEDFESLAKCLPNLTILEVNSDNDEPVMSDNDLQACVKHLRRLRTLIIGCSENFTDYGITGIPGKNCRGMFKQQKYHVRGINENIWKSEKVTGRPLSDLKGLRKLILMGSCKFTDIGIGYGLRFQELLYCHLPYSDNITSWGIARFGSTNPSVESFVLSGVNQIMKKAFKTVKHTHERVKRGDASRSKYFLEKESPFVDDFSLMLPTPNEVTTGLVEYILEPLSALAAMVLRAHEVRPHPVEVNE